MSHQTTLLGDFRKVRPRPKDEKIKTEDIVPESPPPAATKPVSLPESRDEQIQLLKDFDLNLNYGPCLGVTRLERWERAVKFGFAPPDEVRRLVLEHQDDRTYTECLWQDERGLILEPADGQLAD